MSLASVARFLADRLGLAPVIAAARHKTVPLHRHTLWYYLGGMTLFFFLVQIGTGILLMLYYRPGVDDAYESVQFIMTRVQFGWLIRSIHSWSANLMIGAALAHLFSVLLVKAYRAPRELTWVSGCLLFALALGFGFSGYLLPWNTLAYFATKVGTDIAGSVPLAGPWLMRFLRGGDHVTGATLARFYGWHVAILPAIAAALLGIHLLLVQRFGMSAPRRPAEEPPGPTMPFFPDFLLRDLFGWTLALAILAGLAAYAPWELGAKADPFAPAPADIKPEWYFLFMFETLKRVPGGSFLGIEYEALVILFFTLAGAVACAVPFFDRGAGRGRVGTIVTIGGWAALAFIAAMTAVGHRALWPVLVPIGVVAAGRLIGDRTAARARGARRDAAVWLVVALGSAAPLLAAEPPPEESCVTCHRAFGEDVPELSAPVTAWPDDVHRARGLGCVSCHGGDPSAAAAEDAAAAMSPARGFVARPARARLAEFCGRCHADAAYMKTFNPAARVDQVAEYRSSTHGARNAAGDARAATCVDCHGTHGIRPVNHPASRAYPANVPATCGACHADAALMARYGHKDDPVAAWRRGVHGEALLERGDLSAPACNDCHGNHGAVPPGVTSLAFVCGQCHAREAQLFRESFKKALFDATGASECLTCHGNHEIRRPGDRLIGTGKGTVCSQCHQPGDECDRQSVLIRAAIDSYTRTLDAATDVLTRAEHAGMEVSEAQYQLKKEGVSGLVETRALIHSFDTDRLLKRAEEGTASAARARRAGDEALGELQFRRKGLAVSLVFIGVALCGLYLKIREVDARRRG